MFRFILSIFVILAFVGITYGQSITGSDHDFSTASWNNTTEICVVCHAPHVTAYTPVNEPLWNHQTTVATYTEYTSSTIDATMGQPDGYSKLCLSCHDGTVAIDNFGGATGGTQFNNFIGTDLSNDHPVSFVFNAALATLDGELHDPTTTNSTLGGTIDEDLLYATKMQCSSCHDPHDQTLNKFLRIANTGSALCLVCHNK